MIFIPSLQRSTQVQEKQRRCRTPGLL